MSVSTKPITAEELYAMGDIERCELVKGEIVKMPPGGADHGDVAGHLLVLIGSYVLSKGLGKAYAAGMGFTIARNPDTTRAPDAGFVRSERVPARGRGFFDGPPDLAVEVVSLNDLASDVLEKVEDWLGAGVVSVWVVDPRTRTMQVYRQRGDVRRYGAGNEVRDEPTLPGFVLKVGEVFEGE